MKKLIFTILIGFLLSACSKDELFSNDFDIETDVSMSFNTLLYERTITDTPDGIYFIEGNQDLYFKTKNQDAIFIRRLGYCGTDEHDYLDDFGCEKETGEMFVSSLTYYSNNQ